MQHSPVPDPLVAGEPVHALLAALVQFDLQRAPNGRLNMSCDLDGPTGAPLARALMRVEAELLLSDAERVVPGVGPPIRTPDQRRADAFVALVCRVEDALHS
jgi:hypothetical protein